MPSCQEAGIKLSAEEQKFTEYSQFQGDVMFHVKHILSEYGEGEDNGWRI